MEQDPPHPSAQRLLEFASQATSGARIDQRIQTFAELRARLNVSHAVMTNWKGRGISEPGALLAQRLLGVNACWVLDGQGPAAAPDPDMTVQAVARLLRRMKPAAQAHVLMLAESLHADPANLRPVERTA